MYHQVVELGFKPGSLVSELMLLDIICFLSLNQKHLPKK